VIPIAQLDSSSLALWVNYEALNRSSNFTIYQAVLEAAARGDWQALGRALETARTRRTLVRAIHLASLIWHEQRHFLDLVLTNYGARRLRTHLSVHQNLRPLVAQQKLTAQAPLLLPLALHCSLPPSAGGVRTADLIKQQVQDIRGRQRLLRKDTFMLPTAKGPAALSGEGVLEALGFLSQHWSVLRVTDGEMAMSVLRDLPPRLQRNPQYEWPMELALSLGMGSREEIATYPFFRGTRFLSALLLACLFAPYLDTRRDQAAVGVTGRFLALVAEAHAGLARDLRESSFDDCLAAIDQLCRRLWGRTIIDELEVDVERESELVHKLRDRRADMGQDPATDFVEAYHANRVRVVEQLRSGSTVLLDPTQGPPSDGILPALPTPIFSVPSGPYGSPPDGYVTLFGSSTHFAEKPISLEFTWAFVPEEWPPSSNCLAFTRDKSWMEVLHTYVPASKLFLNGFRHRTMLGPELAGALNFLKGLIDVRVGPHFSYSPVEDSAIDQYFFLAEQHWVACDVCNKPVTVENGTLISPTELRSDPASLEAARRLYAKGDYGTEEDRNAIAAEMIERDWSYWVVCEVCVDVLRPQREQTREEAQRYRDLSQEFHNHPTELANAYAAEAFSYQRQGRFREAAERYQRALDVGDERVAPVAAFSLGVVRSSLGEQEAAAAAYRIAMDKRWPEPSAKAAFNLGNLLTDSQDLAGAAAAYARAAELGDEEVTARAYIALGRVERDRGNLEAALGAFRSAIGRADAADAATAQEAWLSIGLLLASRGMKKDAFEALNQAVESADTDLAVRAALIIYLYGRQWGDQPRAEDALRFVIEHGDSALLDKVVETLGQHENRPASAAE
jgi:tetratricopeptide (TPR) repeat protein